jgi:hypothetical protein
MKPDDRPAAEVVQELERGRERSPRRGGQAPQRRDQRREPWWNGTACSRQLAHVRLVRMEMVAPSARTSRNVFGVLDDHGLTEDRHDRQ